MKELIISLATDHVFLVYIIVIFTAWLAGPIFSMIFGVLIKLDYFPFLPVYFALMVGELFGDTVWYGIGYFYGHPFIRKFGKYLSINEEKVKLVLRLFHKYHYRILIISKITNGFGLSFLTLMTAGIARIPFLKFLSLNLIGQFIWSGLLIGIGYYFSNAYLQIHDIMGRVFMVVTLIALIAAFVGFINYMRSKIETE